MCHDWWFARGPMSLESRGHDPYVLSRPRTPCMQGGWGSGGESCISGRYDGCFPSLAASEAILQAAASHTKAFGLPRVRWSDTCQLTGDALGRRLQPQKKTGRFEKKTKPRSPRNPMCLTDNAQPTRVSILDCSKGAEILKQNVSYLPDWDWQGHTATIDKTAYN